MADVSVSSVCLSVCLSSTYLPLPPPLSLSCMSLCQHILSFDLLLVIIWFASVIPSLPHFLQEAQELFTHHLQAGYRRSFCGAELGPLCQNTTECQRKLFRYSLTPVVVPLHLITLIEMLTFFLFIVSSVLLIACFFLFLPPTLPLPLPPAFPLPPPCSLPPSLPPPATLPTPPCSS